MEQARLLPAVMTDVMLQRRLLLAAAVKWQSGAPGIYVNDLMAVGWVTVVAPVMIAARGNDHCARQPLEL